MKRVFILLVLMATVCGLVENRTVNASTLVSAQIPVSVELTVNSPGAGGSDFILKGLKTSALPSIGCSKASALSVAAGNGTSVHIVVVDAYGIDTVKITVHGTVIDTLTVTDDSYIDLSRNSTMGNIRVRQLK